MGQDTTAETFDPTIVIVIAVVLAVVIVILVVVLCVCCKKNPDKLRPKGSAIVQHNKATGGKGEVTVVSGDEKKAGMV